MISPKCDKCKKELDDFGAIILSVPYGSIMHDNQVVTKYHICKKCYFLKLKPWILRK